MAHVRRSPTHRRSSPARAGSSGAGCWLGVASRDLVRSVEEEEEEEEEEEAEDI
jgi:hypothetical protein